MKEQTKRDYNLKTKKSHDKVDPIVRIGRMEKDSGRTTIYVGNLNYKMSEYDIKNLFVEYGSVKYVEVSNKVKGVAFVQMQSNENALKAIKALNGSQVAGRTLKVSIAKERNTIVARTTSVKPKEDAESKSKKVQVERAPKKPKGLDALFSYLGKS